MAKIRRPSRGKKKSSLCFCVVISAVFLIIPILWSVAIPSSLQPFLLLANSNNPTLKVVDCRDLRQQFQSGYDGLNDPNSGMELRDHSRLTTTEPPFHISLFKEYYDTLRWAHIMKKGNYYETGITDQMKDILSNQQQTGLVVDVGQNIGWFSLYARSMGHSVVSFEPNPLNHLRMCESVALNGWENDGTITQLQYGLSTEPLRNNNYMNLTWGRNPGMATFHHDRLAKKTAKTAIRVPVTRLDDVAQLLGWFDDTASEPIHVMKVDVEGHEIFVFEGATRLIQSRKIENILMEWSSDSVADFTRLVRWMRQADYRLFALTSVNGKSPNGAEALEKTISRTLPSDLGQIQKELSTAIVKGCNLWWKRAPRSVETA